MPDYDFILDDLRKMQRGSRRNVEETAGLAIGAIESLLENQKKPKQKKKAAAKK